MTHAIARILTVSLGIACGGLASSGALADESDCQTGAYACFSPTALDYTYSGPGSPCTAPPPPAPGNPIYTYASQRSGGFGGEGAAATYGAQGYACQHPVGSAVNGGLVCEIVGPRPAGLWQTVMTWDGTLPAFETRAYEWVVKTLEGPAGSQTCTRETSLGYSISRGNGLACPPGTQRGFSSSGLGFCFSPRYCPSDKCPETVGNPITIGAAEKLLVETDYLSPNGDLEFVRRFNSQAINRLMGEAAGTVAPLGPGWTSKYHQALSRFTSAVADFVSLRRANGSIGTWRLVSGVPVPAPYERGQLQRYTDAGGATTGWRFRNVGDEDEFYDANGRLNSITLANGRSVTMAYDAQGRLATVTDAFGRSLAFQYDPQGRIGSITHPDGQSTGYAYSGAGAITQVTRPDSAVRTYLYEQPVKLPWAPTGIVDERGVRLATYTYDLTTGKALTTEHAGGVDRYTVTGSSVVTVVDPIGTSRRYTFESSSTAKMNLLVERRQPHASVAGSYSWLTYTYDANGNVLQETTDGGTKTNYTHDLARNLETQRVEGFGTASARTITTQWLGDRRLKKRVAEPLRITTYAYHGEPGVSCAPAGASTALLCSKSVQATTDANGAAGFGATPDGAARTWSYAYNALGQVSAMDGPRVDAVDTLTHTYYAANDPTGNYRAGDLASTTNAKGHTIQFTHYDGAGRLERMVDPNGLETVLDYWPRGWLKSRAVGSAATGFETTTYDYDATGQLTKVTMPDASTIEYGYDDAQRLVSIRDGLGNRIAYTLDALGNRTAEQAFDPGNNLARAHARQFDALGRLYRDIGGTNPAAQVTTNTYDGNGNLTAIVDPLSRSTTQVFDARSRMTEVRDPVNGASFPTRYAYNAQDQLTQVTDPKGLATTYALNGHGELLAQSSPDTGTTGYTYDAAANLKTRLDARGVQAAFTYDELNRLTQVTYPDESVTYVYDTCTNGIGRLCTLVDRTGTTSWTYDRWGRVTAKSQTVSGLTQAIAYAYNAAGQLARITTPSGQVVEYAYANSRPISVTLNGATVLDQAFYEPFGPNGGWRWGNSTAGSPNFHTRLYDADFRATNVTSDLPLSSGAKAIAKTYGWDNASRIASIADLADAAFNASYGYDGLDRLTSASKGASAWGYTFDGVGNRLTSTANAASTTYAYAPGSHRLASLAGARVKSYTYDAAGNMTSDGIASWTYGGHNRPTQVQVGSTVTAFAINALGQRVRKATGSSATRFVYDEAGRLAGEYTDAGGLVAETVWLEGLPVAVIKVTAATPPEQTIDNGAAGFSTTGTWAVSTNVAGYLGANYLTHDPGANAIGSVIVDNTDAGFSVTGTWPVSTSVAGYLGASYRVHAANGEPPAAIVVDNTDVGVTVTGTWPASTNAGGFVGANYQNRAGGTGANTFTWTLTVPAAGNYQAWARWTASTNRATNATYTVATAGGNQAVAVNQQANGGSWQLLGTWAFNAGATTITLSDQANGYVIADAVMLVPEGAPPSTATWQATLPAGGNWRVSARWPAHPNRATNAVFRVQTPGGIVPVAVNQQANGGAWTTLGTWAFNAGATTITLNDQADGYVIADAVRYEPEGALPESANWSPALTTPARYDVYARWTALANRTAQAKYVITHQGGTATVTQNQQANGGTWNLLGTWTFASGQGVRLEAADDGYAIADAVKFVPSAEQPTLGGLAYVHPDHLGTPRAITRPSDNALVWRWENAEPFGDSQPNENPSGLGAFAFNLRFPGQYFDSETGTHYNYFRDFDPAIGRYIQSDPIGLEAGPNTFTYVGGNPLFYSDSLGLDRWGDQPGFGWGMKPGVPLPKPDSYALAVCLHQCLGQPFVITSTHEPTPQHPPGTPHAGGQAIDIRWPNDPDKALCCAKKCGAGFGLNEYKHPSSKATGGHVHIQIPPGRRGGSGDLPKQGCNPCNSATQCCP